MGRGGARPWDLSDVQLLRAHNQLLSSLQDITQCSFCTQEALDLVEEVSLERGL